MAGGCGGRGPHVLRAELARSLPAQRHVCGQDPEGREAGRPPRGAAHEVRAGDQPQDRESARPHDPAVATAAGRRDYPMITRRTFLAGTDAVLLAAPSAAEAQQAAKVARIGWLAASLAATPHLPEAFRQGLRDLGYVEGRNVVIAPLPT